MKLTEIARLSMVQNGLEPDFPPDALRQLEGITEAAGDPAGKLRDMTGLSWCSIDNDDSRDLDQLTVCEDLPGGVIRAWVAVADVDGLVKAGTPIDLHARKNTTSVYTGVKIFPMLPEKLSTGLTSLNENEPRTAVVIEMTVGPDGGLLGSDVTLARVKNKAKLTYNGVGAWLEGRGPLPAAAAKVPGLDRLLRTQDAAAQRLRERRHQQGALDLETLQPRAVTENGVVVDLAVETQNRAGQLIEDFMVAANGVTARFLAGKDCPTLRRVVRTPRRWDRMVEIAKSLGEVLPADPDPKALAEFLAVRKKKDPLRFPDLSLTVVKLMGRGEYVLEVPGQTPAGHFGLAVRDYNHSTAPNRRYPDLVTQRLLKSTLAGRGPDYSVQELSSLAAHCTEQENAADKVERQVRKSASASFLSPRVNEYFDAIVTGASSKGTWVRLLKPPVEGKLVHGEQGLDVGDRVRVKLIMVDIERGYIDFVNAGRS